MKNTRRASLVGLVFLLMALLVLPSASWAASATIRAKGVILMNWDTGEVLYSQNADRKVAPASLTKVLSMYVVFDAIKAQKVSLKDTVRISKKAARQGGSRMGLREGEKVSLEKLLYGMAVASGNDASYAAAEHVAGSEANFIRRMNSKAKKLGMKNSRFATVNGLPAKGQITTARDMVALTRSYLNSYPSSLNYHSTTTMTHRGRTTTNKHPQLGKYRGVDGLKTGWTTASGYNIITTARRGNNRLIAVVLGAKDSPTRAQEVNRLMDAGFAVCSGKAKTVAAVLKAGNGKALAGK